MLIVMAALFGQVWCELSLPNYMSDIINNGIVKGLIHIEGNEIVELYVDYFFWDQGIGSQLIEFAKANYPVTFLWAIEKNTDAIRFYEAHGFRLTDTKKFEEGTTEYLVKMER